jgi:hypothetical protein
MTVSVPGLGQPLVVVAAGAADAVQTLQHQAAPRLATALGLVWREPLSPDAPPLALAERRDQGPGLVPLPIDPGLPLAGGSGHWAEVLGAWRQPALLLLAGDQLQSGLPAAMTALLRQWQVPLLGLVQCDGPWDPAARRADRLPWLGALDDPSQLALAVELAWQQLATG